MSHTLSIRKAIMESEPREPCCARSMLIGLLLQSGVAAGTEICFDVSGAPVAAYTARLIQRVYRAEASIRTRKGGGGARSVRFSSKAGEKLLTEADKPTFSVRERYKCPTCHTYFLQGAFLAAGRICDPIRELRLEFSPRYRIDALVRDLTEAGIPPLVATRGGRALCYYRSGAAIMDILGQMQLLDAMYAFSDTLIVRDLKNQETRSTNCIVKNLKASSTARAEQLSAVRALASRSLLSGLPDDLYDTAMLLLDHPDDSLAGLAQRSVPPISKSGIHHRLLRIMAYAKQVLT